MHCRKAMMVVVWCAPGSSTKFATDIWLLVCFSMEMVLLLKISFFVLDENFQQNVFKIFNICTYMVGV